MILVAPLFTVVTHYLFELAFSISMTVIKLILSQTPKFWTIIFTHFFMRSIKNVYPSSANCTKWSNTLKQFVGNLPTNCLSVPDHFVGLALKGLMEWYSHKGSHIKYGRCKATEKTKSTSENWGMFQWYTANLEFRCNVRSYFHQICYEDLHFVKNSIQKRFEQTDYQTHVMPCTIWYLTGKALVEEWYLSLTLLKVPLFHGIFSCFFNCANDTKSRKAYNILLLKTCWSGQWIMKNTNLWQNFTT